jgi:hypothetical protein
MASTTGLLVPVDLTGYCLGTIDAAQAETFAGATTWYSKMEGHYDAALGSNVVRDFSAAPLWPLEAGMHLHWAMPDGLTHGTQGDSSVDFAALPNRWLLTRVHWVDNLPVTKAWMILSDVLSATRPGNKEAPSLPVRDSTQNFRYLGVSQLFDGHWQEPVIPDQHTIQALFGSPLHTTASGDVAFAAFYPNARNVFGFYDDLAGVDTSQGDAQLMYTLAGWFSDSTHDPMSSQPALADLERDYRWTCADYPSPAPGYTLYHGLAQNLAWNPARRYITDNSSPVHAKVAIGNHPAETLAAYFNGLNGEALPHFDTLFTGFEIGALSELAQPKPGQWSALQETLHGKQFSNHKGGTIFGVQAAPTPKTGVKGAPPPAPPPLPPVLGDALNLLNLYQQEFYLAGWERKQYYGELFAGWYRILQVNEDDSKYAYNALNDLLQLNPALQQACTAAQARRDAQQAKVQAMLPAGLELLEQPAPAFHTPNEPTVLLSGDQFRAPRRYGGDGQHHDEGMLVCRPSGGTLSSVGISVGGTVTTLDSSRFGAVQLPPSNHLAYAADINGVLLESCLLNTGVAASLLGGMAATLEADLSSRLRGAPASGNSYQVFAGTPPSPVAVQWLDGNPWLPMFLSWQLNFHPLVDTRQSDGQGGLNGYAPGFFLDNFNVDPDSIGRIQYAPGPAGITVNPALINFSATGPGIQILLGSAILSPAASDTLEDNLIRYLQSHDDASLKVILQELQGSAMLMQSLSGFNAALLMTQEALQLTVGAGAHASVPVANLTRQVRNIITDLSLLPPVVPALNGFFNPLRAGFFQFSGQIVDIFGQKRPLAVDNLYLADTLATVYQGNAVPNVAYLQPRLAQPARLLFRWLAADSTGYDEMNFHPATTPVCGWLLSNHLNGGLFIYDQQGRPLGSLVPSLDQRRVVWQAAPGDDSSIDQRVDQVMQGQNPSLAGLVLSLAKATPARFGAFWQAVDAAAGMTTPLAPSSDVGMGALIGRPLALAQASLLLEQQGYAACNLGRTPIDPDKQAYTRTDNGLSGVQFPVVLGDIAEIDDGLIGYFKQDGKGGYDYGNFYCEAAPPAGAGVQPPPPDNLLLSPHADTPGGAPSVSLGESKVLLLVDPRCGVHLSSGILPTQYVRLPAEQYQDVLRGLEMTFLIAPVLQPVSQVALPLASEKDYTWSWVDEWRDAAGPAWQVTPDIAVPAANALWNYSPQRISEGWLRLNPLVLRFDLATAAGQRAVPAGASVNLTLTLTNLLSQDIVFAPATMAPEGHAPDGSLYYIHFGDLVLAGDVDKITISAPGWRFQALDDPRYGHYWGATPAGAPVTLVPKAAITVAVSGLPVNPKADGCCNVYFDYYRITGIGGDGVASAALGIEQAATALLN